MFHYNLFVFTEVSPMQEIKTFQSEEFWKPKIVFRIWWVGLKCDFFFFQPSNSHLNALLDELFHNFFRSWVL